MSRNKLILCFLALLLAVPTGLRATHIVGGEMYYEYLGSSFYKITLVVYRDCWTGVPPFDNPASIGIFNANGQLVHESCTPVQPDSVYIPPIVNSPCFIPPNDVCYVMAYYTFNVVLAASPGGYEVVYQRCCRNQSILNTVDPLNHGITISAHIPGPPYHENSNPRFFSTISPVDVNELPPPFICHGIPFVFDHSALDDDGDSIAYELCTPYDGGEPFQCPNGAAPCGIPRTCGPVPHPPFTPPYANIQWQSPFNLSNLLGGIPLAIDPLTGLMTATPNTIGQFVMGVCAKEYRNGVLISTTRRDYQLNVVPCPTLVVAALQTPIINCNSNTVVFQNQSIGAGTYLWDFGDPTNPNDSSTAQNPSYTYPGVGSYSVTLIAYSSFNPGCADTTVGVIKLFPPFNADFTFVNMPCQLTVDFTSTSQNTGSGLSNTWNWDFGDNNASNIQNPSHTYGSPGTYTVTLVTVSDSGCVDTISKVVTVDEMLAANISINQSVSCHDSCDASILAMPLTGNPPFTYLWTDPGASTTPGINGLCAGTYDVTITDSTGCTVVKSVTLQNPPPLAAGLSSTDAYCDGLCIGTATASVTGGTPPLTYLWSDPNGQQTQQATQLCPGTYQVFVTDDNGCTVTDSVTVNYSSYIPPLNATASPNTIIYEGQSVQLNATAYPNGTYVWTPPATLNNPGIANPVSSPTEEITYVVTYTDPLGCENSDTITIEVREVTCIEPEIFIPNAFTPNQDGRNDILYVRGPTIRELLLRVYNRWGEKVFETTHPGNGWDGTYKGKPVMPGVYDYYLEAVCFDNEKFFKKGNVTVIN